QKEKTRMIPGKTAPINRSPIGVSVTIPYNINPILGGIILEREPPVAAIAPAKSNLYPYFRNSGTAACPNAEAVAVPDPDTAPKNPPDIIVRIPNKALRPRESL